ncbi:hypothetical protein F4810DRAFT_687258 [Camillea tinctor]|nr:hypothetical protein F4810DRAFT_687258 [Camillea tinctor]
MLSEITQDNVLMALDDAIYAFRRTVKSSEPIKDITDLPNAFLVVHKQLPIIFQVLESMQKNLSNDQPTEELKESYAAVSQLAEICRKQALYMQSIFNSVTSSNDNVSKLERYRTVVLKSEDHVKIEAVVQNLIEEAIKVAVAPLVEDDLIEQLKDCEAEISEVEASLDLEEKSKGEMVMTNYGSGYQFLHKGKGHQNHCSGGWQFTGDNATNNFPPMPAR